MTSPDAVELKAGATEWLRFSFVDHPSIRAGARLTGTPTVTVTGGSVTLTNKQVDSTGKKVAALVAAGSTPGIYTVTVLVDTDETTPQTIGADVTLHVY